GVDLCGRKQNETVAVPGQSLDVTRGIGVIAERVAQLDDRLVQAPIEVDIGAVLPHPAAQFFASDHLTGPLEERPQNLQRLRLQGNAAPAAPEFAGTFIELEDAEAHQRIVGCVHLLSLDIQGVAYQTNDSAGARFTARGLEIRRISGAIWPSNQSLTREYIV